MGAPRARVVRRPVHGVLLLDKPLGLSSNDALQKCKWLLRAEKAGHTGTLDPLATGALPLCFGAATKFSQLHLDADKTYEAVAVLGVKTTTGDAEGEVVSERPVPPVTPQRLAEVERQFTGPIQQVPPMHSALKKDGKALYEYARAGQEVERAPRDVVVHELRLELVEEGGRAALRFTARVSKGTYIRTLGEDIGETLGCGAHLSLLRRIATGPFDVARCVTLEAFAAMSEAEREAALLPPEALLDGHTRVTLGADDAGRFLSGLRRRGHWADADRVAVFSPSPPGAGSGWGHAQRPELPQRVPPSPPPEGGRSESVLLGTAHTRAGELIPSRLLSPIEIDQILRARSHAEQTP
ncbi:tRNA pseudouridine(55) synthase TruB [Ramlibacter tataouinensis]|uniref:tRNA pseudouridine(55) synthase TruB n=1 Tax=Ramlibacter tataouinensis TaxID=94132 RepID=UPI0022F3C2D5|nr:tRNA pseudouridine(55) synthase TruB [Ramlibacter tataouinensis]WBY02052.1 tRNA pseudouridine(55) synthase TruB [Ramlibacter tataouinensis]